MLLKIVFNALHQFIVKPDDALALTECHYRVKLKVEMCEH